MPSLMMKFYITIFILFQAIALTTLIGQGTSLGLVGGINKASVYESDGNFGTPDLISKNRLTFGVSINQKLINFIYLRSDLIYDRRSWKQDIDEFLYPSIISKTNYDYQYLTVPVLIQFKTRGKLKVFVNGGINNSILLIQQTKTSKGEVISGILMKQKSDDFHFGWVVGGGASTKISEKIALKIESRFYKSFSSANVGPTPNNVYSHKGFMLFTGLNYFL